MFCPNCGTRNSDTGLYCASCGAQLSAAPKTAYGQPRRSETNSTAYLVLAIIATVVCCLPLGIPAIVFAAKIDSMNRNGDSDGAREAAGKAKLFIILSACAAALTYIVYMVLVFAIGIGSAFGY